MRRFRLPLFATLWAATLMALLLSGCPDGQGDPEDSGEDPDYLSLEKMRDPLECKKCHEDHYDQWSGSMHAYAAKDPIFLAMNRRGQRETDGALGDFCIQCHAPMAVRLGLTTDGLNLDEVPDHLEGVTCFFCHSTIEVDGTHNNPLKLADDGVMRGGIRSPLSNKAHASEYSELHSRDELGSSALCGACHDIVTPAGVPLERTFQEWKGTLFGNPEHVGQLSCAACHMDGSNGPAVSNDDDAPERRIHSHRVPGVDIATIPFNDEVAQREAVQAALDSVLLPELCVDFNGGFIQIAVTLENISAGHSFPSGAAQDRRAWVEVVATDTAGAEVFATGVLDEGEPVAEHYDDPDFRWFGDRIFDGDGELAHMFWNVASYESSVLLAPTAFTPLDPAYINTHQTRTWLYPGLPPEEVTLRVHLRPMALDTLQDLVDSGDLDVAVVEAMPTYTLNSASLSWLLSDGVRCVGASNRPAP